MSLVGTCTSAIKGATFAWYVDDVKSDSVKCPAPGDSVHVEPALESCYGIPSCTYREFRGGL